MTTRLLCNVDGTSLTAQDRALLANKKIAAVILFTRNYASFNQCRALCEAIKTINDQLIICIDQEGGRVQRLCDAHFPPLNAMRYFGELYLQDKHKALTQLRQAISVQAQALQRLGVDLNLAPVLDCDVGLSQVIAERSFGADPEVVSALAQVLIDTYHQHQIKVCAKHFPGHGAVSADSHRALPIDPRSFDEISSIDLKPYTKLLKKLDYIMPSHVIYPSVDSQPATFSSHWKQQILRQQLEFSGEILSDDLSMQATKNYGDIRQRVALAKKAGCDIISICNDRAAVLAAL